MLQKLDSRVRHSQEVGGSLFTQLLISSYGFILGRKGWQWCFSSSPTPFLCCRNPISGIDVVDKIRPLFSPLYESPIIEWKFYFRHSKLRILGTNHPNSSLVGQRVYICSSKLRRPGLLLPTSTNVHSQSEGGTTGKQVLAPSSVALVQTLFPYGRKAIRTKSSTALSERTHLFWTSCELLV